MKSQFYEDTTYAKQSTIINENKKTDLFEFNKLHRGSFGVSYQVTEKKNSPYDTASILQMNNLTTPMKLFEKTNPDLLTKQKTLQSGKYRQVLLKLDETESKLVISEKKYGELWRKYEVSCQSIKGLHKQLTKCQEKGLKQLIQLQNKFRLMEEDKEKVRQVLNGKQLTINILNSKLQDKQKRQCQLQKRLMQLQESINHSIQQAQSHNQEKRVSKYEIDERQKSYERNLLKLKQQINRLENVIEQNSIEKGKLLNEIEILYLKQKQQSSLYTSQLKSIEEQYKKWLDEQKSEKLKLIEQYESRLVNLKQTKKKSSIQMSSHLEIQTYRVKEKVLEKEEQITEKKQQIIQLKAQIEQLTKDNIQASNKILNLQRINLELKTEIQYLQKSKVQLNQQNKLLLSEKNIEGGKYFQFLTELQNLKNDFQVIWQKNQELQKKNKEKSQKIIMLNQKIQKYENDSKNMEKKELQLNFNIKQVNKNLSDQILQLSKQNEELTRELFAQRLQSARLKQELEQQESNLKYEYQISLQNVQKELSHQIKEARHEKSLEIIEKEKIYVQMRELQRKYELLISQMLTVDDMMAIATKVHKRHSKFIKNQKPKLKT